tara:strand:+ start:558 stop:821 length:264 start_codon:yes stop_codon:yes gene_type:complete
MTTLTTKTAIDSNGKQHEIHSWFLLANGWEYYITEPFDEQGYGFGYVMGDASEWGSVNILEMTGHIISEACEEQLDELAPPIGWEWV